MAAITRRSTSRGFAAVRITEARENYARQHTVDDTPEGVDSAYLLRNVRVNIAALASLALAPPAPRVTDDEGVPRLTRGASGYDAQLAWSPSEGAVGYRVFWRDAWAPDWQHELTVGAGDRGHPAGRVDRQRRHRRRRRWAPAAAKA